MKRSIWGIQKKSYRALYTYLENKYIQKLGKLRKIEEDLESEIHSLKAVLQSAQSDEAQSEWPGMLSYRQLSGVDWHETWFEASTRFTFRWKKRLFGLHETELKRRLQKLISAQQSELQKMRMILDKLLAKRDSLIKQLHQLQAERNIHPPHSQPYAEEHMALQLKEAEEEIRVKLERELKQRLETQMAAQLEQRLIEEKRIMRAELEAQLRQELEARTDAYQDLPMQAGEPADPAARMKQEENRRPRSNIAVFPIQAVQPVYSQRQARLSVGGTKFWEFDIEQYLAGQLQPMEVVTSVSENAAASEQYMQGYAVQEGPRTRQSPAVAEHAQDLKKKYIVGKLSGIRLMDRQGRLIIDENEVITEQIMQIAEREGKLADLIIHMRIPGLGDSR